MSRLAVKTYCRQAMALLDVPVPCAVVTQRPREIAVGEQAVIAINVPESKERRAAVFCLTIGHIAAHQVTRGISQRADHGNAPDVPV